MMLSPEIIAVHAHRLRVPQAAEGGVSLVLLHVRRCAPAWDTERSFPTPADPQILRLEVLPAANAPSCLLCDGTCRRQTLLWGTEVDPKELGSDMIAKKSSSSASSIAASAARMCQTVGTDIGWATLVAWCRRASVSPVRLSRLMRRIVHSFVAAA